MKQGSDLRRGVITLPAALVLVGLASCASGRQPDTGGVDPGTYLGRFSGEWTLDRDASDDPARELETHRREGAHDGGSGGGAGGHGPGRHGGGILGGGGPDPSVMEATIDVFQAVPDRFALTVTDSLVITTWGGEGEARIPIAGDAVPLDARARLRAGLPEIEAKARWDGGRLRLERRIDGGGTIVDLLEPTAEGDRLLVTRTVDGVRGAIPEITLAFDRAQ